MKETLTERMLHAAAHCESLYDALDEAAALRDGLREIERLREKVVAALPAMREYALRNPKYIYNADIQDPKGVHAWLNRNETPNVEATARAEGPSGGLPG